MNEVINSTALDSKVVSKNILSTFIAQVYAWMAGGLLVTAVVAYILSDMIVNDIELAETVSALILPLLLVELVIVWFISARAGKSSMAVTGLLFLVYSFLNGIFFSVILAVNGLDVAGIAFFATFLTFAVMSIYGFVTEQDLTKWGNIAIMFLFAGIIGSIINIFIGSEGVYWIITYILLGVFVVLVAYDTQKLKRLAAYAEENNIPVSNYAIFGALELYLDFINLFLLIIRILGSGKK